MLEPLQRVRLQDWLHVGDEFSVAFKVNYISEDFLQGMVTSHFFKLVLTSVKGAGSLGGIRFSIAHTKFRRFSSAGLLISTSDILLSM